MPDCTFRGPFTSIVSLPDYSVSFKLYPCINQYHSILYSPFNVSGYLKDRNTQAVENKGKNITQQVVQVLMMCKSCWLTGTQT